MKIIVGKCSGFCYGVKRAIRIAEDTIKDAPAYSIGPLIHNPYVVEELNKKGLKVADNWQDLKNCTGVIRSHGISPQIVNKLKKQNVKLVDATCPNVIAIQSIVKNIIKSEYDYCIIIGDKTHPEVRGLLGFCKSKGIVISDIRELEGNLIKGKKIGIVSQTTQDPGNYFKVVKKFFDFAPLEINIFNTICKDVIRRQEEATHLSKNVSAMIVLGGKSSANTKRLVKICKRHCKNVWYLEGTEQVPASLSKEVKTVGIISGASTPRLVVRKIAKELNG